MEYIGTQFTEVGPAYLKATMPVDHRTVQPMRILHGGAYVVLAETLGSVAGNRCLDPDKAYAVGLSINSSHIRAAREGQQVEGVVRALHLGRSTQVWEIHIHDEKGRLMNTSRLTMAVLPRK